MANPKSEYEPLLKDANVKRWYDNIKRSSPSMATGYLRRIGMICKLFGVTPDSLTKKSVKEATDFLLDIVGRMDDEGKQPSTIKNYKDAVKSWFDHNEIKVTKRIKMPEPRTQSKVAQERSPMPGEVRLLLNACELKAKVASTLMAFAGLRPEVLGNYLGTDGLQVRDLPEMTIANSKVEFAKIPTIVVVRAPLSKARHQYFTFYPSEGCQYLKQFLEDRIAKGEEVKPTSPIYTNRKGDDLEHTSTKQVGKFVKDYIVRAGFDWRPYILRTYFDTRLMLAEADGLIIRDWRVFFMGHRGDIEHTYTLNKGKIPADLLEKMRERYAKSAERHLVTQRDQELTRDSVTSEINRRLLEVSGYSTEEIDSLGDLSLLPNEDIDRMIDERRHAKLGLNGNDQKVVPRSEVKTYITQGWVFIDWLSNEEAIIRLPKR